MPFCPVNNVHSRSKCSIRGPGVAMAVSLPTAIAFSSCESAELAADYDAAGIVSVAVATIEVSIVLTALIVTVCAVAGASWGAMYKPS